MNNAFAKRLSFTSPLDDDDADVIDNLCSRDRRVAAKRYILRDGDQMLRFPIMLEGWAACYQIMRNGSRQITGLLLPGDALYFDSYPDCPAIEEIVALCPSVVAFASHEEMDRAIQSRPTIGRAMRNYGRIKNAVMATWIVNVGRRDALERMAHLICEAFARLAMIGEVDGNSFHFPLTQDDFADVLGLTPVHVNRKLQQLRHEGLIHLRSKEMTIIDRYALQQVAGFDETYLRPAREAPATEDTLLGI
ncbi:Crp/Fnr family transcriptional regulator [Aurantiacibacter poecillastricola]|uniref:Crp/Fnr family transcriptional regulator n=1 Tax=Aurantiacibacter poecillastricola TaxID=3064385 RepID=UPI00273E0A17|nr:Crp/Fnr family transcriptional regulator [Aurantiacibacter sp. 219JJ12-13]MDP5263213.1 Crp/Fnr family transcriptional regulator [Aurantiacibacter sp. 219JJ12-13]